MKPSVRITDKGNYVIKVDEKTFESMCQLLGDDSDPDTDELYLAILRVR